MTEQTNKEVSKKGGSRAGAGRKSITALYGSSEQKKNFGKQLGRKEQSAQYGVRIPWEYAAYVSENGGAAFIRQCFLKFLESQEGKAHFNAWMDDFMKRED